MEYTPNQTAVEQVLALKPFERYQHTIKKAADFELIYTLAHEDGTLAIAEVEGESLISFWPAAIYAEANAVDAWANYYTLAVSLKELLTTHLELFKKNGFLVNVFPKQDKTGFIVSPGEFRVDLEEELENY